MIKPKKSLGQNFLIDKNLLEKIVNVTQIKEKNIFEIGPGTGNLTTYILKKNPKKVIVIEKDKTPHGTTSMSQGTVCAAGTNAQRSVGIEDSPEQFYSDVMKKVNGRTDKDLVRLVTSQAGPMIDWISDKSIVKSVIISVTYP